MVAKKTAEQQSASGPTRASGGPAKNVHGKKAATRSATTKTAPTAAGKKAAALTETAETVETAEVANAGKAANADEGEGAGKAAAGRTSAKKAVAGKTVTKKVAEKVAKKVTGKTTAAVERAGKQAAAAPEKPPKGTAGSTAQSAAESAARRSTSASSTKTGTQRAAGKSTAKNAGAARAAEQTGATTVVAKKTPGTATAAKSPLPKARIAAAEPGELAVRPGEDPWTPEEVEEARSGLRSEVERLGAEIAASEEAVAGLMRDSGNGAGDDEADTGSKNITREHEMALAANAREMLDQTRHALQLLDAGTYGLCENCGNPIGKARMQAFPRATLCVECKQKQERRS
ncbi:TraR/DksA C4-type zinc finger protein [Streptomyces sp. NPDC005423]|uniref:TraR/DksA family transcriptional regulator n=1 Tax=Streptomyces sp. NPDC005423 TaxID=3155343 RepID=UPI0033A831B3